ncbi:type I-C CRISPR-associated protein Cas5c [Fibrobacter sp. UWEL]|uniref:type I-C CRISPR-associated protein Cas5c n=1 Tax=Fibrobacter sp. UWEL TaxID=1896209 RepID=UPI0009228CCA|nr:type I-C CRISPR-associated protein Cas5c [Fibrobacter sp. UWEL]SHK59895.1 CRISPR-associated protein, Cas5d family [Fibrobacter sp. UWEL]
MEHFMKEFCLEVWGDYACFTRPEMKVERVSYDVITPSAARAIFSCIFWKPAILWHITKIEVLNPIEWVSVRRNELGAVASPKTKELFIEENRQQRAGLFLKNVRYRIYAKQEFIPQNKRPQTRALPENLVDKDEIELLRKDENPGKYNAMFERRAKKGQCFNQPYFGCREFSCHFRLIENIDEEIKNKPSINETRDLGFMLYDMDYSNEKDIKPTFFRAKIENGVINVPAWKSEEIRK